MLFSEFLRRQQDWGIPDFPHASGRLGELNASGRQRKYCRRWWSPSVCVIFFEGGKMKKRKKKEKESRAVVVALAMSLVVSSAHCYSVFAENVTDAEEQKAEEKQEVNTTITLPTLVVEEEAVKTGLDVVAKDGLDIYGGASQFNLYSAISMLPGVDIRNGDAYGMSYSHRIRGKADRNIGETLEGLPLKGIGPGGGLGTMMDMENLESVTVEKGAVDVDSGLGYGSDNGMVDMNIMQPQEEVGLFVKQAIGTDDFTRSFIRVDTGNLKDIAKLFVSASYTDASKWKGEGDAPDGKKNVAFGLASTEEHDIQWSIDGVYNKQKSYGYRSMTYEQSQHLSANYDYDYADVLTGNSVTDSAYYGFNYTDFTTSTLIGKLQVPVSLLGDGTITFRPYYLNDEGHSYSASNGSVTDWLVDHDTYGGVLQYERKVGTADLKVGYWYGEDEPPGPPTARKTFTINSDGTLSFKTWERLVDVTDNSHFNSPYIGSSFQFGQLDLNAGLRYLWWTTPSLKFMNATGIGNVSYETALSQAKKKLFEVDGDTYGIFLPKVGGNYQINDVWSLNGSYGRNYNTPQYGFGGQVLAFYKKGYSEAEIQKMWEDKIQPEESDNIDIGVKMETDRLTWDTALFYSLVKNTAGTYYDNEIEAAVPQNAGESQSYGVEMAFGYRILEGLKANLALTYNRYEFTEDFLAANGKTVINAEGNQIPETPEFMANMSLLWTVGDVTVCPMLRYLGERYADVENIYDMDDVFLVDLDISWKIIKKPNRNVTLRLAASNLFDKEYIATSSAGDQTTEISGLSFTAGAPRTIYAAVEFEM